MGAVSAATLGETLALACRTWSERVAVRCGDRAVTYEKLAALVGGLAGAYPGIGVSAGDRVVCQLPNSPEYLVVMGAAWTAGAVHVGASPDLSLAELLWFVDRSEASAVVVALQPTADDPLGTVRAISAHRPGTVVIVADGRPEAASSNAGGPLPEDVVWLADLMASGAGGSIPGRPGPDDVAAIFFTSGTTGRPKGPLGFHGPLVEVWHEFGAAMRCGPEDVHLGHLPMAFGFGMQCAGIALFTGGCLRLMPKFSVSEAVDLIERDRVTVLNGTPTHYKLLLDRLATEGRDVSSLRTGVGSAASFAPDVLRRVLDDLGMVPLLLYGSSELLYVCTSDRDDLLRGAVGRPATGQVKIVGPDRAAVRPGELGEIAFRVRWPVRYWKEPEANRDPGQWYHTGDVGRLDSDGRLYVLGRVKHQINRGGHKIDPGEVETLLDGYPGIADHAVIGVPDPVLGQVVGVCVVVAGVAPTVAALRAYLEPDLARYKLPEVICVVNEIPRNRNGKVDYDALVAVAVAAAVSDGPPGPGSASPHQERRPQR